MRSKRRQPIIEVALGQDVARAIMVAELVELIRFLVPIRAAVRILAFAWFPRLGHLAHQPFAGDVFLMFEA